MFYTGAEQPPVQLILLLINYQELMINILLQQPQGLTDNLKVMLVERNHLKIFQLVVTQVILFLMVIGEIMGYVKKMEILS